MNNIRIMKVTDLVPVNEIYNQAVALKFSTPHTDPISMEERQLWFQEHNPNEYPVFVWDERGQIYGWISFSPYRKGRKALQSAAGISYYVHTDHHHRGIGTGLLESCLNQTPPVLWTKNLKIILCYLNWS